MKNTKYLIGILLLFMTIGFAAISTSLSITGKTTVATTIDDFKVYFSDVKINGVQDLSFVENETSLYFYFYIEEVGTSYTIDYDVTNGSKYYDADLTMTCTSGNEYLSITNTFDTTSDLVAKQTRSGSLVMKKIKSIASDGFTRHDVFCNLSATPVERSTISDEDADAPISRYGIGREVCGFSSDSCFNVIDVVGDDVVLLAQYGVDSTFFQSTAPNSFAFSETSGWEYTPGPKEIDVQTWGGDVKTVLDKFQPSLPADSVDLISLKQLKKLGCTINNDYSSGNGGVTCENSEYYSWLINGQEWWTRSASSGSASYIWVVSDDGSLYTSPYSYEYVVRPVVTVSKTELDAFI